MTAFSGVSEHAVAEEGFAPYSMAALAGIIAITGALVGNNFESLTGPTEGGVAEFAVAEAAQVTVNNYSIVAGSGAFVHNGQAVTFRTGGLAQGGAFSLAGQSAGQAMPVAPGSFAIAGQSASVNGALSAAYGAFNVSGGKAAQAIGVDAGTFALLGYGALGTQGIAAPAGSFSLIGFAAYRAYDFLIAASEGAVAEFGVAEFPHRTSFGVLASAGNVSLAGLPLGLRTAIASQAGLYALQGQGAGIAWPVEPGQFSLNGQATKLSPSLVGSYGAFSLSGGVAGIAWPSAPGFFDLNGQPSVSVATIVAQLGTFTLTGSAFDLLPAGGGAFALNGQPALSTAAIGAERGLFNVGGQSAKFPVLYNFPAAAGAFSINGQESGKYYTFRPDAGMFALSGYAALRVSAVFNGDTFALTGYPAGYLRNLRADVGRFTVVGWSVASVSGPTGDFIYLVELQAHDGTQVRQIYLSSDDWRSSPLDTPASQYYESRIRDPGNFERHLFSQGATSGKSTVGAGDIVILSGDPGNGALIDEWLTYGWDGRPITIKALPVGATNLSAATTLFRGRLESIDSTNPLESFSLKVSDRLADLNKPLLTERYAGTTVATAATAEGNADLKAQIKQQVWGRASSVPLQPANVYDLIYKATRVGSYTTVQSITVYDGGLALTNDGDSATLSALRAATIVPGHYRTCLATGDIRLGALPATVVTADVVEGANAGERTAAQIVYRMMREYGIPSNEIVIGSFTALDTKNAAECQILVTDETAGIDVFQQVLDSIGGWLIPGRADAFEVGRFEEPVAAPALLFELEEQAIQDSLDRISGDIPVKRVNLQYGKVWHVHSDAEVLPAVSAERRNYLTSEYRSVTSYDAAVEVKHLKAPEMSVETCLVYLADAQAESDRRLALFKVEREQLNVALPLADGWAAEPSQALTLVGPRLGLQNGKPYNIIGRIDDYENKQVVVRVWG